MSNPITTPGVYVEDVFGPPPVAPYKRPDGTAYEGATNIDSAQDVFNFVYRYLTATATSRAVRGGEGEYMDQCMYRTPDGRMCGIGALIADSEYSVSMEGATVEQLASDGLLPKRLVPYVSLLLALQNVHDAPDNWGRSTQPVSDPFDYYRHVTQRKTRINDQGLHALERVAIRHRLDIPPLMTAR